MILLSVLLSFGSKPGSTKPGSTARHFGCQGTPCSVWEKSCAQPARRNACAGLAAANQTPLCMLVAAGTALTATGVCKASHPHPHPHRHTHTRARAHTHNRGYGSRQRTWLRLTRTNNSRCKPQWAEFVCKGKLIARSHVFDMKPRNPPVHAWRSTLGDTRCTQPRTVHRIVLHAT